MRAVHVFDDFLEETLLQETQTFFAEKVKWVYGWPQGHKDPFSHWNHDFLEAHKKNQSNLESRLYELYGDTALARVWDALRSGPLYGHDLVRCYANAHTFGVEGHPHTDSGQPGNYTAITYITPHWQADWAGELVLFDDAGDIFFAGLPNPGRIIIIQGNTLHAARAVSRTCPVIRVCLVFKTKISGANAT
jgi:Rps23 Pro-64 3,4-dihydroxylase Tpa1-like proline 4-hydroxylase